jgi:hypothetical protein
MQSCVQHNKRTNRDLFREQVKSTLNTQMFFKNHSDIIQTIEHFNITIQQAAWNSTPPSHTKTLYFTIHNDKRKTKGKT